MISVQPIRTKHRAMLLSAILMMAAPAARAEPPSFSREIRPILSNNCFHCHGPDASQRKGDLRLDIKTAAFADRGGYFTVVPEDPDGSELIKRITSDDADERMPPPSSGKKLTPREIQLIRQWIQRGANWNRHWAFVAPTRSALPKVANQQWAVNSIDRFILARLEREGLRPSPAANKVTLLRRLSLDLIGLPPTIEEVDAFLADNSDGAYQTQVRRLLNSPHYGERWGRHWLDAARYADSDGYEKDKSRQVWFYRDWVINALNRDLPYDQFIIEQIAGDLLPNPQQGQVVATGFLRNSMTNEEGGVDPEQFRMEAMFDRMDAIGKSILGLTIQCGQCHDHKYDPLTQRDYYRIFAFLNNSHESTIAVYTAQEQMQRAVMFQRIRAIERELKHRQSGWQQRMEDWQRSVTGDQPKWTVVRPYLEDLTTGGQKYLVQKDGSLLAQGYAPTKHVANFRVETHVPNIRAFRLELLNDPNLPMGGPGRSIQGTAALTEFEVTAAPLNDPTKAVKVKLIKATADVDLPETPLAAIYNDKDDKTRVTGPVTFAIDGKVETAWGIDVGPGRRNQPRKVVFLAEKPINDPKGLLLTIHLSQKHGGWNSDDNQNHNLGRFRLSVSDAADATADPLPQRVRNSLSVPRRRRTTNQLATLFSYWRTTVPAWKQANDRIQALWEQHPNGSSQLVLQERRDIRDTRMLERGSFLKPLQSVEAATPSFLHTLPVDSNPTRLSFARWLVDRKSPTTARAIVNRVWQAYFGIGLVSTSEDLGLQSEAPSHPGLLDWLAVEFMEQGWSLKKLHQRIVNSATYRQSSRVTSDLYSRDPYNRLMARGSRTRVEAEIVYDIALAASGLLNPRLGGPSVFPPAPEFLFIPPASYGPKVWRETAGAGRYRRAIYTFRFRSVPYPALQAFDAPNGDFSCVRRMRSNTPLQALTTLNEPTFVECARALALKTLQEGGDTDSQRLSYAFRRCLARKPSEQEQETLYQLLRKQIARFNQPGAEPRQLAANGPTQIQLPHSATQSDLAAWTIVSRVLLNLDETITKE